MGAWHPIGNGSTLAEGALRRHTIGDKIIVVTKCHGTYYAFDHLCSHAEGDLSDGWLEGHEVECPLHGARFDIRTGAARCLPATAAIATYPVRLEGDALFVEVE